MNDLNYNPDEVKFCHLGNKYDAHSGRITLCTYVGLAGVYYGVAFCSPKDKFTKDLGRQVSNGRLVNDSQYCTLDLEDRNHKGILLSMLCDIIDRHDYPDWAYEIILDNIDYYASNFSLQDRIDEENNFNEWMDKCPNIDSNKLMVMLENHFNL